MNEIELINNFLDKLDFKRLIILYELINSDKLMNELINKLYRDYFEKSTEYFNNFNNFNEIKN